MLKSKGRDNRRVLCVRFRRCADLRTIDEHLGNPAILEPADATGVDLTIAFEPEEPMGSSVLQVGSEARHCRPPTSPWAPKSSMGAPVWEGAPMGFLGAHGASA